MKYPCVEATLDIETPNGAVRLWIDRKEVALLSPVEESEVIKVVTEKILPAVTMAEFVDHCVAKIPGLNAIQVISRGFTDWKRGVVVYVKDFTTDVHG